MGRAQWEAAAAAQRAGFRSLAELVERRERERRVARLAADFERERREHVRRAADRAAQDSAAVSQWLATFHAKRAALGA